MNELENSYTATLDDLSCITVIQEYLLFKNLKETSETLRKECLNIELPCPNTDYGMDTSILPNDSENLISALNTEDFDKFLKLWNEKVPAATRAADYEARRLFFFINIAMATRSQDGMEKLKQFFIMNTEQTYTKEAELLHYYALPYVAFPSNHPAFQHLYKDSWWLELRTNLTIFIKKYTLGQQGPRLPYISLQSNSSAYLINLKLRCKQLQNDYQRLLAVAGELTLALERSIQGSDLNLADTLTKCTRIYPELFPSSNNFGTPESLLRRSLQQKNAIREELELDHRKLKAHLAMSHNSKTRLLLMQALRWRISRSDPEQRDIAVAALIRHDILGINSGFSLVSLLISPGGNMPHPLQQSVARLLNAFASLRVGRDYLSMPPSEHVVGTAIKCLTESNSEIKIDEFTADMLLAMLQKLSLRRIHRETMINGGMVEWLIPKLEKCLEANKLKPDSSTYSLEYATALLMNLCLHTRAKQRCIPLSGRVLQLLSGMLGNAPCQVLPYVNGSLYSLLCEPLLNQQARHMGIDKLLTYYLKQSDGELRRQLEHILGLLRGPRFPPDHLIETHSEDEGEVDISTNTENVEEEIDLSDPVNGSTSELTGEDLLKTQYKALFPSRGPTTNTTQQQVNTNLTNFLDSQEKPRLSTPLPASALKEMTDEKINKNLDEINNEIKNSEEIKIEKLNDEIISKEMNMENDKKEEPIITEINNEEVKEIIKENDENIIDESADIETVKDENIISKMNDEEIEKDIKNEYESEKSFSDKERSDSSDRQDEVFSPKPRLARTPPPMSATSRLQELSKSVADIQNAITKI